MSLHNFLLLFLLQYSFVVQGEFLSSPSCQIVPKTEDKHIGNAGCLIKIRDHMLVVRERSSQKLNPPAGTAKKGETAQCTAHRETWEEAGIVVKVGKLLKRFENNFSLYECFPIKDVFKEGKSFDSPLFSRMEVTKVLLVKPQKLKPKDWRFPKQFPHIKKLFDQMDSVGTTK